MSYDCVGEGGVDCIGGEVRDEKEDHGCGVQRTGLAFEVYGAGDERGCIDGRDREIRIGREREVVGGDYVWVFGRFGGRSWTVGIFFYGF